MHNQSSFAQPSSPRIAAVIGTRDRAELLERALEGLTTQTLDTAVFEVVVVDDDSTDGTREVVTKFQPLLPLKYIYQRHAGLAAAKNLGLFSTLAPIVIFLDDDDVPSCSLLEQHLETHARYPDDRYAVLGHTTLHSAIATDPLMHFVTEVGCFLFSYPALTNGQTLDYSHFWGGRSSCKRAFLLQHGVFNPVFQFGCEDIELGFRLARHDFKVIYNSNAVSTMVRRLTVDQLCNRLVSQGRSNVVFSQLHADAEVQRWTEVAGAKEAWRLVADAYDALMRSARHLDTLTRRKREWGFELEAIETQSLHHAYWLACKASKLKGINEQLMEATLDDRRT
jgi:glycosyltransferase involved in cell wall biosynthesis